MTIAEFIRRTDLGFREELVRGRVVRSSWPTPYHGWICGNVLASLSSFVENRGLGFVAAYSGIITGRDPDTLRGADVTFYSRSRVPAGRPPNDEYLAVMPDLVIEVFSPDDRWPKVLEKLAEYLNAGVAVVAVVDTKEERLHVDSADGTNSILDREAEWTLPTILPGFAMTVGRFFE